MQKLQYQDALLLCWVGEKICDLAEFESVMVAGL